MTKEKILSTKNWNNNICEILEAMDEHASQISIGFAEWIDAESYHRFQDTYW